jgi:DNA repair protein SbcD/Mre11
VRILHTSDWHLGRSFHRVGMLSAQAAFVDHLVEVVRSEAVDVVVVAGDVYDRALPSVDVVELLDDALCRLAATGAHLVLSSGNHDSAVRLGFGSRLLESARVHVRADVRRCAEPIMLADEHGPVAIYPLPYLEPSIAAPLLGGVAWMSHQGVLQAAADAVRADLATRPGGTRSVLAAHAFVVGGLASDSERDISVGGVAAVAATVFDGIDYVALGHLHGRQRVRPEIRYSGSPLAYSFSEHAHTKGSWLVTLDRGGLAGVEAVDAPAPRRLALLRGELETLLGDPTLTGSESAWCQVTLTDAERPADAMQRLRARFAHTVELRFDPQGASPSQRGAVAERVAAGDDVAVCCDFLQHTRGRAAGDSERQWLQRSVTAVRIAEMEASGVAVLRAHALAEHRQQPNESQTPAGDDGESGTPQQLAFEVAG